MNLLFLLAFLVETKPVPNLEHYTAHGRKQITEVNPHCLWSTPTKIYPCWLNSQDDKPNISLTRFAQNLTLSLGVLFPYLFHF